MTHDSWIHEYSFGPDGKDMVLGINVGAHLILEATINDKIVVRKYSPISPINQKGKVTFVIKEYPPTPEWPSGGEMSQWICAQPLGYLQSFCEVMPKFNYMGDAMFKFSGNTSKRTKLGLLAGGTGLTPIFSIINAMRLAKDTAVQVDMIFSNKTENDILLKEELDAINSECPNIRITHTLTRVPPPTLPSWAK